MPISRHLDSNHSHTKEIHVFVGLYAGENTTSVGFIKLPLPKQAMGWIFMCDNKFVKDKPLSVCYLLLLGTDHWCQIFQDTQVLQTVWQCHQEHRLCKKRKVLHGYVYTLCYDVFTSCTTRWGRIHTYVHVYVSPFTLVWARPQIIFVWLSC